MDWFGILWLGALACAAYWQASWGWRALRTGIATYYFHYEIRRDQKPFEFRMLLLGRLIGFVFAVGMFSFGLEFFWNLPK
jgi:hypothetical protein